MNLTINLRMTRQQWREAYNALKDTRPVRATRITNYCKRTDDEEITIPFHNAHVWTSLDLLPDHIATVWSRQMNQQWAGIAFEFENKGI